MHDSEIHISTTAVVIAACLVAAFALAFAPLLIDDLGWALTCSTISVGMFGMAAVMRVRCYVKGLDARMRDVYLLGHRDGERASQVRSLR